MYNLETLKFHAHKSFENSKNNISKLTEDILNMPGMSGIKTRHLYNNLCSLDDANYLEIGTYKGSSFVSAIYKNNVKALAIDNWSEFEGPKIEFFQNVEKYCGNQKYNFIEKDSFEVTNEDLKKYLSSVDIYMYDGCHEEISHEKAITHYQNFFSKYFIILIDDWRDDNNWSRVQRGTFKGFEKSNIKIHDRIEIITLQENTGPKEFWNGFGLFVCENLSV